jgi:hypothetical protein
MHTKVEMYFLPMLSLIASCSAPQDNQTDRHFSGTALYYPQKDIIFFENRSTVPSGLFVDQNLWDDLERNVHSQATGDTDYCFAYAIEVEFLGKLSSSGPKRTYRVRKFERISLVASNDLERIKNKYYLPGFEDIRRFCT